MSKQWYGWQCLRFLTYIQMLMHVIAHGGCTDTVRESALKADSGRKKIPCRTRGLEPASVLRQAFQSDALPTELLAPRIRLRRFKSPVQKSKVDHNSGYEHSQQRLPKPRKKQPTASTPVSTVHLPTRDRSVRTITRFPTHALRHQYSY